MIFNYEVLKNATGNFVNNNVLGGGFGKIYKVRMSRQVVVKKLNRR
eukprot:Gb_10839 [translate_table: standard]